MAWTEDDPGQGDPDGLLAMAADLQADADDAADAARMLRGVQNNATDAVWKGHSADAFRDRINEVPGHLDRLTTSYADAAAGIRSYAASVRQIADDARSHQRILRQSTADLQSARAQQAAWTPPSHPATGQPIWTAVNPHDDEIASANTSLKKAQVQLHDLAGQRKTADGKLVVALKRAHAEGMRNRRWWQRAVDVASAALGKITVVLMVVALVAILVLAIIQPELIPGLLVLAGQVLTGLSAAQLAFDGTRKAEGETVSWASLGMDAVGMLPGIGRLGAMADSVPLMSRGVTTLRGATESVRGITAAGAAFVNSLASDVKATRFVVRIADTGLGTTFIANIEREGKTAGKMLTDAKAAAKGERSARGDGKDFVITDDGEATRSINFKPRGTDPRWGLTKRHVMKHLFGSSKYALRTIDPGGQASEWLNYVQQLASRVPSSTSIDGMIDILGQFPRSDGIGFFQLGIRLSERPDGTYDLVTLLTRQGK